MTSRGWRNAKSYEKLAKTRHRKLVKRISAYRELTVKLTQVKTVTFYRKWRTKLERHSSFSNAQKTVGLNVQVCVYMATGIDQENRAYWYLACRGPMKALPHRYRKILLFLFTNETVVVTLTSIMKQSIEPWALHRVTTHSCARHGFEDRTEAVRDVQNRYLSLPFLMFPFLRLAIMQICCIIYDMAALRCQRVETCVSWAQAVRLCVRLFKQECKILCINP